MPHKILITLKMRQPKEYKKYLSRYETVTGKSTAFMLKLKNVGDKPTPKGTVAIRIELAAGISSFAYTILPIDIQALEPNDNTTVKGREILLVPGLWVLIVQVNFEDKQKIEYYQSQVSQPYKERWVQAVSAVERHQLDGQALLEKLVERKEELPYVAERT